MKKIASVLSLTRKLISIKSETGKRQELDKALDCALAPLKGYKYETYERKGVKSVLVYNTLKNVKKYKIILNGHLDVVPGKQALYKPCLKGNNLYGVGAWDMKAGVSCLIAAFAQIAPSVTYPIGLQLTTDEEVGGFDGTQFQIEKGVSAEFVITGEPTNMNVVYKAKGIMWITITCKGASAHGAYPWRGDNAVWKMNNFLNTLKRNLHNPTEDRWVSTYNVSSFSTPESTFNKVPDICSINLDIRYRPQDKSRILKKIKSVLPKDFKMHVLLDEPGAVVKKNNPFLRKLRMATKQTAHRDILLYGAHGSSDVRHYTRVGSAGVEFGPSGGNIGSENEYVDVRSLPVYINALEGFLLSLNT